MRKVYVDVSVRLIVSADEGIDMSEVMAEMTYNFNSSTDGADIVEAEIMATEVTDSR